MSLKCESRGHSWYSFPMGIMCETCGICIEETLDCQGATKDLLCHGTPLKEIRTKEVSCECGAEIARTTHSTWCPMVY